MASSDQHNVRLRSYFYPAQCFRHTPNHNLVGIGESLTVGIHNPVIDDGNVEAEDPGKFNQRDCQMAGSHDDHFANGRKNLKKDLNFAVGSGDGKRHLPAFLSLCPGAGFLQDYLKQFPVANIPNLHGAVTNKALFSFRYIRAVFHPDDRYGNSRRSILLSLQQLVGQTGTDCIGILPPWIDKNIEDSAAHGRTVRFNVVCELDLYRRRFT